MAKQKRLFECPIPEFNDVITKLSKNKIEWVFITIYEAGLEFYGFDANGDEFVCDFLGIVSTETLYDPAKTQVKSSEDLDFSETLPKGDLSDPKNYASSLFRQGKKTPGECVVKVIFDKIKCLTKLRTITSDTETMEIIYNNDESILTFKCRFGLNSRLEFRIRSLDDPSFL